MKALFLSALLLDPVSQYFCPKVIEPQKCAFWGMEETLSKEEIQLVQNRRQKLDQNLRFDFNIINPKSLLDTSCSSSNRFSAIKPQLPSRLCLQGIRDFYDVQAASTINNEDIDCRALDNYQGLDQLWYIDDGKIKAEIQANAWAEKTHVTFCFYKVSTGQYLKHNVLIQSDFDAPLSIGFINSNTNYDCTGTEALNELNANDSIRACINSNDRDGLFFKTAINSDIDCLKPEAYRKFDTAWKKVENTLRRDFHPSSFQPKSSMSFCLKRIKDNLIVRRDLFFREGPVKKESYLGLGISNEIDCIGSNKILGVQGSKDIHFCIRAKDRKHFQAHVAKNNASINCSEVTDYHDLDSSWLKTKEQLIQKFSKNQIPAGTTLSICLRRKADGAFLKRRVQITR